MIVDNKACAVCIDWSHEPLACLLKRPKPCKETGCTANHHTSRHGSTNPKIMTIKMTLIEEDSEQFGLLPVINYIFKKVNQGTTVFMDEGSNTSLITTKLANALYLKGKVQLTTVLKACNKTTQAESCIHHEVTLQDRQGKKHKIKCIEVPFITETQIQPNLEKVMIPFLPFPLVVFYVLI